MEVENSGAQRKLTVKGAVLYALSASAVITLIWFLLSKSVKSVALALIIAALAVFLVNIAVGYAIRRVKKPLHTVVIGIITVIISAVAFLWATVYTLAPTQLFYPHFDEESYAFILDESKAEELTFDGENGKVGGWLYHNASDDAPVVLYFCGNGESASQRVKLFIEKDAGSYFEGYNIAVFDYPGYGKTDGAPSEASLKAMGLAAFDYMAQRNNGGKIVLFGFSMGTGVANYIASEREAAGLMLMAPYADGYDLFNGFVNIFYGPLRTLVSFKMESVKFAERITEPVLLMTSYDDEIISIKSSERLSEAYAGECEVARYTGLSHNDYWGDRSVLEAMKSYLAEVKA